MWQAPELLQSTVVGPHTSADIFSVGRLLFKIVIETRPLQGWQPREIITAARCQVALLMHWPPVPSADGGRTISEKGAHIEPRLLPGISELQKVLREACVDCWLVDSCAEPLKGAVAERRIDTSSPGPPLADFVDKSSPGLSGTTRPLEPRLEQEESCSRLPMASTSPASTLTSVIVYAQGRRQGCHR